MLSKFINTGVYPTDHVTGGIVPANGETLLTFNRHCSELFLKYLAGDTRHRLVGITPLTFAVGALDFLTVGFPEESTERLIVIAEGQVIHCETLIGRNYTLGGDRQLKLFLFGFNGEALSLQIALCLNRVEVTS